MTVWLILFIMRYSVWCASKPNSTFWKCSLLDTPLSRMERYNAKQQCNHRGTVKLESARFIPLPLLEVEGPVTWYILKYTQSYELYITECHEWNCCPDIIHFWQISFINDIVHNIILSTHLCFVYSYILHSFKCLSVDKWTVFDINIIFIYFHIYSTYYSWLQIWLT